MHPDYKTYVYYVYMSVLAVPMLPSTIPTKVLLGICIRGAPERSSQEGSRRQYQILGSSMGRQGTAGG